LADESRFKLEGNRSDRRLFEAVLSPSNTMVGKSIKESRFRHRYSAVVLSVSRHGARLNGRLGDLRLEAGDTLLIEAQKGFLMRYRNSRDFLLVSKLADSDFADEKKAVIAISIFVAMILATSFSLLTILESSLIASGALIATGCISFDDAGKSIDYSVLVVIACAFSLGAAVEHVGLASIISKSLLEFVNIPIWALVAVYLTTALLTELMTNNAAAIIMLPIAMSIAGSLGINYEAFAVAVMIAASASFMTPMGYQTNLMVMGPGGYRFGDYFKVGAPLSIIVAVMALVLIPIVWPLV
jgi:di/tricarboxylate transporter